MGEIVGAMRSMIRSTSGNTRKPASGSEPLFMAFFCRSFMPLSSPLRRKRSKAFLCSSFSPEDEENEPPRIGRPAFFSASRMSVSSDANRASIRFVKPS